MQKKSLLESKEVFNSQSIEPGVLAYCLGAKEKFKNSICPPFSADNLIFEFGGILMTLVSVFELVSGDSPQKKTYHSNSADSPQIKDCKHLLEFFSIVCLTPKILALLFWLFSTKTAFSRPVIKL